MIKKIIQFLFFSLLLFCTETKAQDRVVKNGRIVAKHYNLDNVAIHNLSSDSLVFSEKGGYFKIPIAVNDTLLFTSENFKSIYTLVSPSDLYNRFLYISLDTNENFLEELVIDGTINRNTYINPKNRKVGLYKDLYTATSGGPISKLVNLLSGRTSMIKKAISYEQMNDMADAMVNSMSEKYFTDELNIPNEQIGGFGYFLLDDVDVVQAVKARNEFQLQFLLPYKAKKYLDFLKEENQ